MTWGLEVSILFGVGRVRGREGSAYEAAAVEAHDDGPFAGQWRFGDEDVGADFVVRNRFVGRLEDLEALEFGGHCVCVCEGVEARV